MNSDSSETEQSGRSDGHRQLVRYSPRGSLSDMSDGSSRDSPEPVPFEIKQETDRLEMDIVNGTTTQMMFNVHTGLTPVASHHQERGVSYHQQSQRTLQLSPYQDHVGPMNSVGEPVPQPPATQMSVILYNPSSAYQKPSSCSRPSVPIAEVAEDPERELLDSSVYELSKSHEDPDTKHMYRVCKLPQHSLPEEHQHHSQKESDSSAEFTQENVDGILQSPLYHHLRQSHQSYLSNKNEEPPVLTYEGGPRSRSCVQGQMHPSNRDSSFSEGDPHDSDKEASSDDESPTSSHSVTGGYQQQQHRTGVQQPPSPQPSSQVGLYNQGRDPQAEVKGTALPHKLRLKHRAMSTGSNGTSSGQESPTSPPSTTPPPLPELPYRSFLPQQSVQGERLGGAGKQASLDEGTKKEGGRKESAGRRNKKHE